MKTITRPTFLLFVVTVIICAVSIVFNTLWISLLLIPIIALVVDIFNCELNNVNLFCGILFLKTTKYIKTDYGRFYLLFKADGNRVLLMRDRFFYLENINNYGNLEELKSWLKNKLKLKQQLNDQKTNWSIL